MCVVTKTPRSGGVSVFEVALEKRVVVVDAGQDLFYSGDKGLSFPPHRPIGNILVRSRAIVALCVSHERVFSPVRIQTVDHPEYLEGD